MNRIILAYAPANAALAESIDRQLSRIGIPFEHARGALAAQIASAGEPVLLLVTDNFLVNRASLEGLLPVLQALAAENRLVAVIADGISEEGKPIPTQIDRMANALHYMKYWQDVWLTMSDQHQHAESAEKDGLVAELDATRGIANQVGDIISTLRDAGYLNWEQFEANDFEAFFQKFSLQDWHGQYKRLVAQDTESQVLVAPPHLPEMPVLGGLLTPEPIPDPEPALIVEPEPLAPVAEPEPPQFTAMEHLTAAMEAETAEPETPAAVQQAMASEEEQAAQDAWFWIEKGHLQRGLDLFQIAIEQYPQSEWLKAEYARAAQQENPPGTEPVTPAPPDTTTPAPEQPSDEAKSYDLMGDMAAERGDYLFAKYCWDRVVEIEPATPHIYRKLGLMTAEHLRDYRETAAIYLRKALEADPQDAEIRAALGDLADLPAQTTAAAPDSPAEPAVETIETPENQLDESALAETGAIDLVPASPEASGEAEVHPVDTENLEASASVKDQPSSTAPTQPSPLVLITGATSGIGRATAEIFARNGYRLILTGRRVDRLVALKNHFEAEFGTEALLLPFDVRDQGAAEAALANLPESFRDIDILVNNAGLAKGLSPIHEGNLDHWETMIDTNVKGLLYVTRLVSPGMVQRRKGHIINLGSSAGKEVYPKGNVYCATKFAVDALSRAMRLDLHAYNIRVSQVSPGHVEETEFAITRFDGDAERARIYDDFQPLKSSDVAEAIYFMATRPPHVNIQDLQLFATQQASSMVIDRSGRTF